MRPRLALVPGEPAGIGPELVVLAAQQDWAAQLVVFGDAAVLRRAAGVLGLPLWLHHHGETPQHPGSLELHEFPHHRLPAFGVPDPANTASLISAISHAARACIDGELDGLVTAPVHKAVINQGGITFTGMTDLLADQAGCRVVMMLANPQMRVALQTVHLPLREVADQITAEAVTATLRIVDTALRTQFGIAAPTIAVLGLNPHAGEEGHLGREELDVLIPTLTQLRSEGLQLVGPLPADTAFLPEKLRSFDAVLAMYHDQGLPVLKHADFAGAVNITLGLPYPRVAVDHGTALDLAGKGMADPSSLYEAIRTCTQLAQRHRTGA